MAPKYNFPFWVSKIVHKLQVAMLKFWMKFFNFVTRDGVVSTANRLLAETFGFRSPKIYRNFSLLHKIHTGYWAKPSSYRTLSRRVRRCERKSVYLLPYRGMVRNEWFYTTVQPILLRGLCRYNVQLPLCYSYLRNACCMFCHFHGN